MPISIHLTRELLRQVDRRARSLGLSRSGYVAQTLRQDLESRGWSSGFFERLRSIAPEDAAAARALTEVVERRRSRRRPPRL